MSELQRCELEIADAMREETLDGLLWEMDWRSEIVLLQLELLPVYKDVRSI
jgi:hypothetical protein